MEAIPAHTSAPMPCADDLHGGATPGRCIFCDQRCDASAICHEYCREAHEQELRNPVPRPFSGG